TNSMISIGLSAMPVFVRLTRGQVLSVKTDEYVEGARSIGLRSSSIITRYILPNFFAPILVQATLTITTAIIAEASLSFLGLGQQP
ncbi:ABC transporter permease subunit, partial [Rhizobium leguminosarum]|uniref:ABC transporter permease subunit n=1 Tax=Rhizobium leguminosarum TaxID=384 RepID=UPI003F95A078